MTLQETIDQAQDDGDTHVIKATPGEYAVDINAPIKLKSNVVLDLTGVVLTALATDKSWYRMIAIEGCENVTIIGGMITGERYIHLKPPVPSVFGPGGASILIAGGSRNIKIQNTYVWNAFADGIQILDGGSIEISNVVLDHNSRIGLTVSNCDGLHVHNSQFSKNGGQAPGNGIDLETELPTHRIADVLIEKNVFYGNEGAGIGVSGPGTFANIRIGTNDFDMKKQPIWTAGNAGPLGTPWWAFLLNRSLGWTPGYRWWGYPTHWTRA